MYTLFYGIGFSFCGFCNESSYNIGRIRFYKIALLHNHTLCVGTVVYLWVLPCPEAHIYSLLP